MNALEEHYKENTNETIKSLLDLTQAFFNKISTETEYKTLSAIEKRSYVIDVLQNKALKQNIDYKLINRMSNPTDMYESFSYLYEKDMKQALVNIYKKDNKLIVVYYEADSECYDIVLDSVDSILRTLKIYTGKKVN